MGRAAGASASGLSPASAGGEGPRDRPIGWDRFQPPAGNRVEVFGMSRSKAFSRIANHAADLSGRATAFTLACASIALWMASGPLFDFSDTWQLVMNTWTNVVTFLMVFLIQNAQNRDTAALQIKIDEVIRTSQARNKFIGIENMSKEELDGLRIQLENLVNHAPHPTLGPG